MTNEAAERLRTLVAALIAGQRVPAHRMDHANDVVNEALAAERRATVERIRHALLHSDDPGRNYLHSYGGHLLTSFVLAILDEEAAR